MHDSDMALVERLFDAFNNRDTEEIAAVCSEEMEFFPPATAEAVGRKTAYVGPSGLYDYLIDVAEVWEELQITPSELERWGAQLLVLGRVYARSREHGIRDMPAAWVWEVRDERFVRGVVFPDPEDAIARFGGDLAPGPLPR
ncbi:MAG TPA: nuclear transport factor 2 family protein [Solirubrobacterales bacterium]